MDYPYDNVEDCVMITHTMDFDPNISVFELFKTLNFFGATLISLNEQPNLPLPSVTIEITKPNLDKLLTQI
jgi:hypothetical protein